MTYNMYHGADFFEIFTAPSPEVLVAEVAEAYSDMQAGNVSERVDAIADQIEAGNPTLVGLQEVALWQIGPPFDPAPATHVTFDYLQMLLDELGERGLHYSPVAVQTNLEAELTGVFSATEALDIRFTDRVVILARTDLSRSRFTLEATHAQSFTHNLEVSVLGMPITIYRGWTAADVKFRGKQYRFVNAHLESFAPPIQYLQAEELISGPTNVERPVVLVGDFNSDAEANQTTYQILTGGGFSDVWDVLHPTDPGYTWALSGEIPSDILTPSQRLDLVLTRGPVRAVGSDVVGETHDDRTPSGFRPSDHAGVVATLVLEP
jgi:endonuclease/exonuclease/phosphatase family metal-dependent hydrolase